MDNCGSVNMPCVPLAVTLSTSWPLSLGPTPTRKINHQMRRNAQRSKISQLVSTISPYNVEPFLVIGEFTIASIRDTRVHPYRYPPCLELSTLRVKRHCNEHQHERQIRSRQRYWRSGRQSHTSDRRYSSHPFPYENSISHSQATPA